MSLGSLTTQAEVRSDASMDRVEAVEIVDTPMVSLLPIKRAVKPISPLKDKGKEKVEIISNMDGGSSYEKGVLQNLDKNDVGGTCKEEWPSISLKAVLANKKVLDSNPWALKTNSLKKAQTSNVGIKDKAAIGAMDSANGGTSKKEGGLA